MRASPPTIQPGRTVPMFFPDRTLITNISRTILKRCNNVMVTLATISERTWDSGCNVFALYFIYNGESVQVSSIYYFVLSYHHPTSFVLIYARQQLFVLFNKSININPYFATVFQMECLQLTSDIYFLFCQMEPTPFLYQPK